MKSKSESLPDLTKVSLEQSDKAIQAINSYVTGLREQNKELAIALALSKTKKTQAQTPDNDDDVTYEELKDQYLDLLEELSDAQNEIARLKKDLLESQEEGS
ncbi:MAG: hypothetical protein K1060chlam1_00666 [Candidatus Anoxychlamydiales bacterium]|nr:hypothetical protein [Candidatus Anoxychlamydiales bacterium]